MLRRSGTSAAQQLLWGVAKPNLENFKPKTSHFHHLVSPPQHAYIESKFQQGTRTMLATKLSKFEEY